MARTSIKAAGTAQRAEDPVSDVVLAFLKEAAASARELEQLTGKPQAARLAELAGDIREGHLDIAAGIRDDIVRDLYQARRAAIHR